MKQLKAEISPDSGLSPKVRRVFEYKAVGKTESEIAKILYKSITTINSQTGTILEKLDCKNIQEAIAKASAEGWLTFKYITKNLTVLLFLAGLSGQMLDSDIDARRPRNVRIVRVMARRPVEVHA